MNRIALEKLTLRVSTRMNAAEVALRRIPNDDPGGVFVSEVLERIRRGDYMLDEVMLGETSVGITVYFVDCFANGYRELVSVATYCECKDVLRYVLERTLLGLARDNNCQSVRMHTVRHGLIAEGLEHGWEIAEVVIRKRL